MADQPVYSTAQQLLDVLGQPSGQTDRVNLAVVLASRWVDRVVGQATTEHPDWQPGDTLVVVPAPVALVNASVLASVRFYRSPDFATGSAGGADGGSLSLGSVSIPDAELILLGHTQRWGVA